MVYTQVLKRFKILALAPLTPQVWGEIAPVLLISPQNKALSGYTKGGSGGANVGWNGFIQRCVYTVAQSGRGEPELLIHSFLVGEGVRG